VVAGRGGELKRVLVKVGTVAAQHSGGFERVFMMVEGEGVLQCEAGVVFETDAVIYEVNFREDINHRG
jgi:hypothetical protein